MSVWDHFEKQDEGTDHKKGKCMYCEKIFSYASTIHNLKQHLARHNIHIPTTTTRSPSFTRRKGTSLERSNRSILWKYFTRVDFEKKRAKCNNCDKVLSYLSTTANLKIHLKIVHKTVYVEMLKDYLVKEEDVSYEVLDEGTVVKRFSDDDDSQEYEIVEEEVENSEEDIEKPGGSVWSYFERAGSLARCAVCHDRVPRQNAAMRGHLRDHHPKLLPAAESDQDEDAEEEHYTEVIYLEDPPADERKQKRKRVEYSEPTPSKRRPSPPRERPRNEHIKKSPGYEEIDSFGTYITCLLKSLPKDVCSAIQRDIINIIMTAKLQKPEIETPVIIKPNKFIVIENGEEIIKGSKQNDGKMYSPYTIKVDSGNIVGTVGPEKNVKTGEGGLIENSN